MKEVASLKVKSLLYTCLLSARLPSGSEMVNWRLETIYTATCFHRVFKAPCYKGQVWHLIKISSVRSLSFSAGVYGVVDIYGQCAQVTIVERRENSQENNHRTSRRRHTLTPQHVLRSLPNEPLTFSKQLQVRHVFPDYV